MNKILLNTYLSNEDFVNICRNNYRIELSDELCERINKSNKLVNKWVHEGRVMYGVTTGFGAMCGVTINSLDALKMQKNILLSHAVSVGEPLQIEYVRGIMLMVIQNISTGYTGASLETLLRYVLYLNEGITPFTPKDGSVGYLTLEAHIALTIIGEGKVYHAGKLCFTRELLSKLGITPHELSYKEGLVLISGTTSATAIANLALYDMEKTMKSADIIGSFSLEVSKGTLKAFDERLMSVRPHKKQAETAQNVRKILETSQFAIENIDYRLQDALSIRCIPQQHGSVKQQIENAKEIVAIETNSCCDNPIVYPLEDDGIIISGCNADSAYVGMAMDAVGIAITSAAKMSERRNNRLIDGNLSEMPWFLIKNPGLNSGLMIPQYTQAGLLNEMRILSHPATVDNTSTCGNQEDYVANGYTACKKAIDIVDKFEYILAIELLSVYQTVNLRGNIDKLSDSTKSVMTVLKEKIGEMNEDVYLHPFIEEIKQLIKSGELNRLVEKTLGKNLF